MTARRKRKAGSRFSGPQWLRPSCSATNTNLPPIPVGMLRRLAPVRGVLSLRAGTKREKLKALAVTAMLALVSKYWHGRHEEKKELRQNEKARPPRRSDRGYFYFYRNFPL